jgi:hypothetical protein
MVRQAHHDRLDLPLVPSIKLRTGSELVEGYTPFKTFTAGSTRFTAPQTGWTFVSARRNGMVLAELSSPDPVGRPETPSVAHLTLIPCNGENPLQAVRKFRTTHVNTVTKL